MPLGWRGIVVEWHRLDPQELPEHYIQGHGIAVNLGNRPISFGWKDDDKRVEGVMNPGDFHLLTLGESNTPRWSAVFDEVSLLLDPRFIADVAGEGLSTNAVQFATQRSGTDASITKYAEAFKAELANGTPNGPLYVETLTIGLTLHLLSSYAIAKPKIPVPRGKLSSAQLRRVVDFIMERLGDDVSLLRPHATSVRASSAHAKGIESPQRRKAVLISSRDRVRFFRSGALHSGIPKSRWTNPHPILCRPTPARVVIVAGEERAGYFVTLPFRGAARVRPTTC